MTTPAPAETPVACTLDAADAQVQLKDWAALAPACRRVETRQLRASLWFDAGTAERLRGVATREAQCCAFLQLTVSDEAVFVRLDISAAQSDAQPVIDTLVAHARGCR
jgi:hypothetical protein